MLELRDLEDLRAPPVDSHQKAKVGYQLVKHPTSAQVMISQFMGSSPASGSMLTAQSLESASDSGCPSLSIPLPLMLCLSKLNKH